MEQSPIMSGPGGQSKPGKGARAHELFGMGLDTSNVAGLLVVGAVVALAALSVSFGGLTVSVS